MFKTILLPVDLPNLDTQDKAVKAAVSQAQASGAALVVMTVVPDFGSSLVGSYFPAGYEQKAVEEANERLQAFTKDHVPAGVEVRHVVGHGTIYREIIRTADKLGCELIVMGSHRPDLQDYLLGPNAARVVRHARCSVMVVRD